MLSPKLDTYIKQIYPRTHGILWKRIGENAASAVSRHNIHELRAAITRDQASQHLSMDGEEAHEALVHS